MENDMKRLFGILTVLVWASAAQALTTFDETLIGDAGDRRQDATTLGTLTAGDTFSLTGTVNGSGDQRDWFSFSSSGGFTIDLGSLSLSDPRRSIRLRLRDASDNSVVATVDVTGTGTNLFGTLDAGDYYLEIRDNRRGLSSYGLSVVAPVPLPAPIMLLLTALGGLGIARWRKQRRSAA